MRKHMPGPGLGCNFASDASFSALTCFNTLSFIFYHFTWLFRVRVRSWVSVQGQGPKEFLYTIINLKSKLLYQKIICQISSHLVTFWHNILNQIPHRKSSLNLKWKRLEVYNSVRDRLKVRKNFVCLKIELLTLTDLRI